jgi:hypothetical protein
MRGLLALSGALVALSACSPASLKGVDTEAMDSAISRAIGDSNTCVLLAETGSGKIVHQYNTHAACRAKWPSCEGAELRSARDLVGLVAQDRRVRTLSCNTQADASRGVAWAAGPIAGRPLVYVAVMEGDRAFPGLMIAEKMSGVFKRAGF